MATRKKLKKIKLNENITLLTNKESQDISKIETLEQALENKLDKNNSNLLSNEEKQKITNLDNTINWIRDSITEIDNKFETKVDKVSGKSLSTNDFTSEYKNKLDDLDNQILTYAQPLIENKVHDAIQNIEIINSLDSTETRKPLSAKQGRDLKLMLDNKVNWNYTIKCLTQQEYNQLSSKDNNTLYFIK